MKFEKIEEKRQEGFKKRVNEFLDAIGVTGHSVGCSGKCIIDFEQLVKAFGRVQNNQMFFHHAYWRQNCFSCKNDQSEVCGECVGRTITPSNWEERK